MLTDYEVSTAVRSGLAEELRDLQAEPELVQKVRYHVLRHRRRRAVRTGALVVLALVVAVLPVALRGCRGCFPSAITRWAVRSIGGGAADCGRPIRILQ